MSNQLQKAQHFAELHSRKDPLVLYNSWDVGSALAVAAAGAKAIATGSWSVAAAHGFGDGEQVPLEFVLANAHRICAASALPVSIDFESGYGANPESVANNIARLIETGAVGCNLEDSFPESGEMRDQDSQVARVVAARAAADRLGVPFFINARTDLFLVNDETRHDVALVRSAIDRGKAYAAAGARGFFVPGLANAELIRQVVAAVPLPVNVMAQPKLPAVNVLRELGVARISHGPGPFRALMKQLTSLAADAIGGSR
jgi:2-methylisocitrate lyase-like PEP mutase family enzyme